MRAPREDLAVLGQRHLDAGDRLPDCLDPGALDAVDRDHARRLGQPVSLDERDTEGVVVLEQLGRGRRRPAHGDAGAVEAEPSLEWRERRPGGEAIRERQPEGRARLPEPGAGVAPPDHDRQPVQRALEPRRVGHTELDGRGELFPDPWHAREISRRDLAQVLEERIRALDEVHDVAGAEGTEYRHEIFVDVSERQVRDDLIVLIHGVDRQKRLGHPEDPAVRQHRPLRRPGGPGRVDDHRRVLGPHGREALVDHAGVCLDERLPLLQEVLEKADPFVAEPPEPLRVPDHDPLEPGLRDDREHLVELLRVLDEDDPCLGVMQEISDLLRARRRVDAARGAADGLDSKVAIEPLRPVLGEDSDVLLMAEPRGHQCGRDAADFLTIVAPCYPVPDAVLLEADREPVALPFDLLYEERRYGSSGTPNRGRRHHLLLLR